MGVLEPNISAVFTLFQRVYWSTANIDHGISAIASLRHYSYAIAHFPSLSFLDPINYLLLWLPILG
jgi:hypothetical protein